MSSPSTAFHLPRTDERYGHICPVCSGPKTVQAAECQRCWNERRRGDTYWARRTCADCGGTKSPKRQRCFSCAVERLRNGAAGFRAQPQPANHPWRKKR